MNEKTMVVISGAVGALLGSLSTYFTGTLTYKVKVHEISNNNWVSLVNEYNQMNVSLRNQITDLTSRLIALETENKELKEVLIENGIITKQKD